ncbi:Unknown protein, partial [Striga hermonthica]
PPPRVEEQTLTVTRSEMQKMIAEAVATQVRQAQVEQTRVEQARIEQPQNEPPPEQQAQSRERQNQRADEEESSIRTINPQAQNDTLEQLLAQVWDLQARVEGRKAGSSKGHPFSQHILDADLPQGFRELNIWYDGSTDPSRHLRSFENMAVLHRYSDPVQCRAFLTTLRGPAHDWFHQLPPRAIKDFDGFSSSLLNQFASVRAQEKSYLTLIERKEPLRAEKEGRSRGWRSTQYTPLSVPNARILEVMEKEIRDNIFRWPRTRKDGPTKPKSNLYCRFHKDYGHNTDECRHLKDEIERLIKAGHLKEFIYKDRERSIDVESAYNVILGRPALKAFQAVVSTYHMKLKFPVGNKVGEARGDQKLSRTCYQIAVKTNQRTEVKEGKPISIEKRPRGSDLEPHGELMEIQIGEREDQVTKIGKKLEEELRKQLVELLREFMDIFAFSPEELTGIDPGIMEHKLNVDSLKKPVKQRLRHHGTEIDKAIEVEVDKLLKAKHIKEIQFPEWISNTVMVRKALNKWRMCIDFRDLNLACPKDHYPLPRIDQLVDSTAGCELLSMMDASPGYHQIPLAPKDQSKVSFVTSRGTYCYVVMPFGLKNVGATYQRLMDRMFKSQLGRNMEVYVDDILVKSKSSASHPKDLRETFETLRTFGMKLNPNKCAFGVKAGRFLGYVVTERGIEVNKDKVQAIIDMTPPKSIKDVQVLTGRIAGLSRFIARAAERSFPFFKLLKKKTFQWGDEAQMEFDKLKEFLSEFPLLTKTEPGDELVLYISVGTFSLSSILLRESAGAQHPIYYTSRVLQGADSRYSDVEKAALTVVITARKLRPYFLNHTIIVRTNFPLGETLGRPTLSGRLVKWAVELSEYSIRYEPRRAIKAQALADFIQEGTKGDEKKWVMHVNGSSAAKG